MNHKEIEESKEIKNLCKLISEVCLGYDDFLVLKAMLLLLGLQFSRRNADIEIAAENVKQVLIEGKPITDEMVKCLHHLESTAAEHA